ncbi:uncharacterized protein LOC128647532 [Bombina bombina]|uniref:uncharacterized protein LOC128647532 n=1 Tax=Bombina bombina TaxID=8345 RepID=UPI00235A8C8B|nr:uncharacterized protein LOC128647532 [Bombina bombina]
MAAMAGASVSGVSDDVGPHMLIRLISQLSPKQCEDLLLDITESLGQRREYDKDKCPDILVELLDQLGDMSWDIFSDALYDVTRKDVSKALGKSFNKGKASLMTDDAKGYAEGYRRRKRGFKTFIIPKGARLETSGARVNKRDLNSLKEEDLIVEREQQPPYSRPLTAWRHPLIYWMIFGFFGAAVLTAVIILVIVKSSDDEGTDEEEHSVLSV